MRKLDLQYFSRVKWAKKYVNQHLTTKIQYSRLQSCKDKTIDISCLEKVLHLFELENLLTLIFVNKRNIEAVTFVDNQ